MLLSRICQVNQASPLCLPLFLSGVTLLMEYPTCGCCSSRKSPVLRSQRRPESCPTEWRHLHVLPLQLYYPHQDTVSRGCPCTHIHTATLTNPIRTLAAAGPCRTHADPIITGRMARQSQCFPALRCLSGAAPGFKEDTSYAQRIPLLFLWTHTVLAQWVNKDEGEAKGDFHVVSRVAESEPESQLIQVKTVSPTHGPVLQTPIDLPGIVTGRYTLETINEEENNQWLETYECFFYRPHHFPCTDSLLVCLDYGHV